MTAKTTFKAPYPQSEIEAVATAEPQRHGTIKLRIAGLHPLHDEYGTFELEGVRRVQVDLSDLQRQLIELLGSHEADRLGDEIYELIQRRALVLALAERMEFLS